jgi:predicted solute-binding protein
MKLRISLVDYLNAAPLGWSFLHGPLRGRFEVVPSSPASCADQLARAEVDIGLIPSIEYQRIPDLEVIPGIAIAATSAVRSVLVVRPKGLTIRSVALDTSSRTSAVLVELLLRQRFGLAPELVPHAPDLDAMLRRCDAALLIGDAALRLSPDEFEIMDLAEAWIAWQRRPFVFAFWACRQGLDVPPEELVGAFHEAKAWGLGARDEIAAVYSKRLGLAPGFLRAYLESNIDYELGAPHLEGLERFYALAAAAGLIPEVRRLRLLGSRVEALAPPSA